MTPAILDKPLSRLLSDIVRAQAQQPPPGHDPDTLAAARGSSAAGAATEGAAVAGPGGEQALRSKLADYVMLDRDGSAQGAPMSLEALKEQVGPSPLPVACGCLLAGLLGPAGAQPVLRAGCPSRRSACVRHAGRPAGCQSRAQPVPAPSRWPPTSRLQIQDKVRAKKAAQAAEEKRQRKEQSQDETDRLRQALRSGKAGRKQQAKGRKPGGGFGS